MSCAMSAHLDVPATNEDALRDIFRCACAAVMTGITSLTSHDLKNDENRSAIDDGESDLFKREKRIVSPFSHMDSFFRSPTSSKKKGNTPWRIVRSYKRNARRSRFDRRTLQEIHLVASSRDMAALLTKTAQTFFASRHRNIEENDRLGDDTKTTRQKPSSPKRMEAEAWEALRRLSKNH